MVQKEKGRDRIKDVKDVFRKTDDEIEIFPSIGGKETFEKKVKEKEMGFFFLQNCFRLEFSQAQKRCTKGGQKTAASQENKQ